MTVLGTPRLSEFAVPNGSPDALQTVRSDCQNQIVVTVKFEMNSVVRVNAHSIEAVAVLPDHFDAKGRVAQVFADPTECPNELSFQILIVGIQFVPDSRRYQNRPAGGLASAIRRVSRRHDRLPGISRWADR